MPQPNQDWLNIHAMTLYGAARRFLDAWFTGGPIANAVDHLEEVTKHIEKPPPADARPVILDKTEKPGPTFCVMCQSNNCNCLLSQQS